MLAMEPRSTGAPSADTDNTLGQSASGIITSIISTDISSPAETCQKPELPTSHREGSKTNFSPWEMTGGELQGEKKKKKERNGGEALPTKQPQISSVKASSMDFNMERENMGLC